MPIEPEPAGLSTVTTVGLLILAIGALAAVSAWLLAWYRRREAGMPDPDAPDMPTGPDVAADEPDQPVGPPDAT